MRIRRWDDSLGKSYPPQEALRLGLLATPYSFRRGSYLKNFRA